MTIKIGKLTFVNYDARGDVLYLRAGDSRPTGRTYGAPEAHAVRFDENGNVIGITIVKANCGRPRP